jgi:hypothetical protein
VAKRKKLLLRPHRLLPLLPHLLLLRLRLLQLLMLLATLPRWRLKLRRLLLPSKLYSFNKKPPSGGFLLCSDVGRSGEPQYRVS